MCCSLVCLCFVCIGLGDPQVTVMPKMSPWAYESYCLLGVLYCLLFSGCSLLLLGVFSNLSNREEAFVMFTQSLVLESQMCLMRRQSKKRKSGHRTHCLRS